MKASLVFSYCIDGNSDNSNIPHGTDEEKNN